MTSADQIRAVQIAENESNPMWVRDLAADYAEALKKLDALEAEHAELKTRLNSATQSAQSHVTQAGVMAGHLAEHADGVWLTRDEAIIVAGVVKWSNHSRADQAFVLLDERLK